MRRLDSLDLDRLFLPIAAEQVVGLAVSGGADSLALMLLAARWAKQRGGPALVVYSVDHGLRPEADSEVAMVLRESQKLGLRARGLRWDGVKPTAGLQAAARAARYGLMASAMAQDGARLLLTAHHLGDQAETVLMRLAHSSGIAGLRGMQTLAFVEGCEVFRPLLSVHPEQLAAIVREAGLTPVRDLSNEDEAYERVRWRKVLPELQALGLTLERLGSFAQRMDDAASLIAQGAEDAWPELVLHEGHGRSSMARGRFAALNRQVAVAILGQLLQLTTGDRSPVPLAPLEGLVDCLRLSGPMAARTLHGCVISANSRIITVRPEATPRRSIRKAALSAG